MSSKDGVSTVKTRKTNKYHLLQKLHFRQLYGDIRSFSHGPKLRFFNQLPPRLAFSLSQLAPLSALTSGHVFLGFTKCGQFLLSYTHSCDTDEITLQMTHRYRLHWWLVVPYAQLRKVAEVMLFGDQDIQEYAHDYLSITICQWPNDLTKILVYGCSNVDDGEPSSSSSNRRCHLTITAVPSLNGCLACYQVAASYEEEEVAERWNSCIRLSCLQHGYTVHTSYDMVPPHPRFLPSVQLRYKDWVVLNAGNFIHVLRVTLENTASQQSTGIGIGVASSAVATSAMVSSNWSAVYQNRLAPGGEGGRSCSTLGAGVGSAVATAVQDTDEDNDEEDIPHSYVRLKKINGNATQGRVFEIDSNKPLLHCNNNSFSSEGIATSFEVDIGESSSSDTELEGGHSQRRYIDRSILTEADRDREWEILISNVPPRTTLTTANCIDNTVDTDSASDVEICANDNSSISDSSFCTVKDISVRFDMLKHGDIMSNNNNNNNLREKANGGSCVTFGIPSVTTRSKSLQKCKSQPSYNASSQSSCTQIFSSSESYSCNDDSDDSTICARQCEDAAVHEACKAGPSNFSRRFSVPNDTTYRSSTTLRMRGCKSNAVTKLTRSRSEDSHSEHEDNAKRLWYRTLPRHSSDNTHGSNTAENEYEFIDEIADSRHEKLSVFRKRRLADKKYEFSDENSENVPKNYRSFRNQSRHPVLVVPSPAVSPREYTTRAVAAAAAAVAAANLESVSNGSCTSEAGGLIRNVYERLLSPNSGMASPNDVLRPINQNISSPILSPRSYDWDRYEKLATYENSSQQWEFRDATPSSGSAVPSHPGGDAGCASNAADGVGSSLQTLNCVVDINRCYIEVDDELVSVITDIEDDELSCCTGYHNALPLEVHGAGYTQMHMISSSKAERLVVPCVWVRQLSLDVEQFCHSTAHALCSEARKRYSCCSDYNVEIVDVCPNTGNIVAIASLLVQADHLPPTSSVAPPACAGVAPPVANATPSHHKTRASKRNNSGGGNPATSISNTSSTSYLSARPTPSQRRLYTASSTFVFSIETKEYHVLDRQPLLEEDPFHMTCYDVCGPSCEERWWRAGSRQARQLRALTTYQTSYYCSVKVLSNQPFLRGNSLTHIMEGQHLMAIVLGNMPNVDQ